MTNEQNQNGERGYQIGEITYAKVRGRSYSKCADVRTRRDGLVKKSVILSVGTKWTAALHTSEEDVGKGVIYNTNSIGLLFNCYKCIFHKY